MTYTIPERLGRLGVNTENQNQEVTILMFIPSCPESWSGRSVMK